nr:hypothetical protein [Tanacetum cinerariifolium]
VRNKESGRCEDFLERESRERIEREMRFACKKNELAYPFHYGVEGIYTLVPFTGRAPDYLGFHPDTRDRSWEGIKITPHGVSLELLSCKDRARRITITFATG